MCALNGGSSPGRYARSSGEQPAVCAEGQTHRRMLRTAPGRRPGSFRARTRIGRRPRRSTGGRPGDHDAGHEPGTGSGLSLEGRALLQGRQGPLSAQGPPDGVLLSAPELLPLTAHRSTTHRPPDEITREPRRRLLPPSDETPRSAVPQRLERLSRAAGPTPSEASGLTAVEGVHDRPGPGAALFADPGHGRGGRAPR